LNKIKTRDCYPLPLINDALDALEGSSVSSLIDANSGFWQIGLEEEDKKDSFHNE